jgi:hypothetical protein
VRSDIAEDELVPIGHGLRNAVRSGHAAGAADIFNQNGVMELAAESIRDDARDGVARSTGGKGHYHGHRATRPVLTLGASKIGGRLGCNHGRDRRRDEGHRSKQRFHLISLYQIGEAVSAPRRHP